MIAAKFMPKSNLNYGLTLPDVDAKEVYIADSESSSIRALNLQTGGSRLLVGGDPVFSDNLFKVYVQSTMGVIW